MSASTIPATCPKGWIPLGPFEWARRTRRDVRAYVYGRRNTEAARWAVVTRTRTMGGKADSMRHAACEAMLAIERFLAKQALKSGEPIAVEWEWTQPADGLWTRLLCTSSPMWVGVSCRVEAAGVAFRPVVKVGSRREPLAYQTSLAAAQEVADKRGRFVMRERLHVSALRAVAA